MPLARVDLVQGKSAEYRRTVGMSRCHDFPSQGRPARLRLSLLRLRCTP